jgi:hypothetical protein
MATGKVTKRTLDALLASGVAGFLWDEDLKGFGAKIGTWGTASYVLQYRLGDREAKTKCFTIGAHGSPWTPTTARAEATRLLHLVGQGVDPVSADKERRREAVDFAFSSYADLFAAFCKGKGWRTLVLRSLRLHLKPVFRDKPITRNRIRDPVERRSRHRRVGIVARL